MAFSTDTPERLYGAMDGAAITPSDTADVSIKFTRGIIVGGAGAVKVTLSSGAVLIFPSLAAGIIHPICATRIWATGTNATSIVAVN
jgi:hypothetical protein